MKKLVSVICMIGLFLILSSCNLERTTLKVNNSDTVVEEFSPVASFCNMKIVAEDGESRIWMDKNTGVLYYRYRDIYCYCSAITPIMKPDGTCLTLDEWKEKVNYKEY